MKPAQMKEGLDYLLCNLNVVATGHPRYHRGFVIERATGCTIGRMTIYDGFYDHVKWYCGHESSNSHAYISHGWNLFVQTGKKLPHSVFLTLYSEAVEMAKKRKAVHQAWRDENPKLGTDNNGKPKKRKSLQTPRISPLLDQLIREEYADKPSPIESIQPEVKGYRMTRFTNKEGTVQQCPDNPAWHKENMQVAARTFTKANFRIIYVKDRA